MNNLYKENAQSWDACISVLTFSILKGKNVGWILNQFDSTELMGTPSTEPVPDPVHAHV